MHGDNKRMKDSESLIVQYDDHYADIPLARINEAETLDDYILLPVIDHRQYDHSTHCAELVIHSMCNCKYDFDYDSLRGISNERKHESVSQSKLSNRVCFSPDVSHDKYTFIDLLILFSSYD